MYLKVNQLTDWMKSAKHVVVYTGILWDDFKYNVLIYQERVYQPRQAYPISGTLQSMNSR